MPVSMEQWRASVGLNNAARSCASIKCCSISQNHILEKFLLSQIGGSASKGCSKQRIMKGLGLFVFVAFSVSIVACILHCSGDIEVNPGPEFEMVPANLSKVRNIIWDAKTEWYDLGLELNLNESTLQTIKKDNPIDVKACFREMLSEWLKMIDPLPSWEGLLEALKKPCVGHKNLAMKIAREHQIYLAAPPIEVVITGGNPSVEEKYCLSCTVSGAEDFSPTITYCWSHNGVVLVESLDNTLSFPSLSPSHAGQYTCQINLTSPFLKDTITATSNTHNISLKGCPMTPPSHPMDSTSPPSTMEGPNLPMEGEVPKGLLQKTISQQTQDLEDEFNDISIRTYDKIEKDYTVNRFKARLMTLPIKYKEEHKEFFEQMAKELDGESTINCIWRKLSEYWNFMNYTLLENLIRNIGDHSLKQNMKSYLSSLESFRRNTRLCDFAKHCPVVESRPSEADLKEFVLHLKLDWETCTLEQLEELKGHIIRKFLLPSFALILKKVSHGSLIVTWLLPAQIASTLVQDLENTDNKGFFKEYKIECMTIDGKEYKYSSIPKYAAFLKDTYSTMEGKNLAAFKLVGIEKEIDRSEMDSFTKSTIRGDKDDVIYKKYPMIEDEVVDPKYRKKPRLVLIEGAPGVGKTTFSEQFCFKWSQGQRLNDHNLLVLLPLRDNRVRSAKSISDLFHHPQLQGAIAQEVESSQGEGVVLWLEAWDELEQRMREESSIFLDLVHGRKLPKATIIITSRPWATKPIVKSTSIRVDQHIELVTTPTLELGRVLREERVHPDIRSKFLDYVNYYPAVKAAMHTPVTANIVTDVFQWSRDMESNPPTTVTRLYTAYTCKLLMQHFSGHKAHGKQSWKIGSLEDLPPDVHQQLLALSKLAWEGIMKQQLTFSSADVGGVTLGLMESVKELYRGQDAELSYHFIHLTLQEFLAAYHITQLPLHTQQQLIIEHVKVGHLSVVMKFYFGLSKFNTFTTEMIREHISDYESAAVYHWMYEGGDTEAVSNLLASRESIKVSSSHEWSPLDYYVVGHSIAYSQSKWELNFILSYMGNEGIEMLSKGLMKMRAVTWKGEITRADFEGCDIHSIEHFLNIPHPIVQKFIEMDLGNNKLDVISSTLLSHALTSLRTLTLYSCGITSEGAVQLSAGLAVNKSLTRLELKENPIGDIGAASIGNTIKTNAVLEHLEIGDCEITSEGAVQLSAGLAVNKSLTSLGLWGNPIGDIGAASICDVIKTNAVLEHLNIGYCEITSQGCIHIAAALSENSTLLRLEMEGNAIGVEGAKAMSEMLEKNISLKILFLHDDDSYEEGVDVILSSLQQNTSLTALWLSSKHERPAVPRVMWLQ